MDRRDFVAAGVGLGAVAAVPFGTGGAARADEYLGYDAVGLADLVRRKQATPAELLEAAIARCEVVDPKVNSVVVRHYDFARECIRKGLPKGAFTGVPFLLKDMGVRLAGTVTTVASHLFEERPEHDSELVSRFRRAGLVIFGKTATPEIGMSGSTESARYGATRNPWNLDKSAGASSGGACAAVAAGIVPAAHASDGGGSIRAPASMTGLFGFKPGRGVTPEGASSWGSHHVVTRSVRDSAALLDLLAGPQLGAMFSAPLPVKPYAQEVGSPVGKLKIGLLTEYDGVATHPACLAATLDAARLCESLGHTVEVVKPPVDMAALGHTFLVMFRTLAAGMAAGRSAQLGRPLTQNDLEIGKWMAMEAGRKIDAVSYAQTEWSLAASTAAMAAFFQKYDVMLSPTLARPAVDIGVLDSSKVARDCLELIIETYGTFTVLGSFAGLPSMSVPLHWADGLPVGTMFQSAIGQDALLLRLASQLEQARPWSNRRPPLR